VGVLPREIGRRVDPHDAYREQFAPLLDRSALAGHARLLVLDCLPRLIVGHRLPGLQAGAEPGRPGDSEDVSPRRGPPTRSPGRPRPSGLGLFVVAMGATVRGGLGPPPVEAPGVPAALGKAVCRGWSVSSAALVVGFVVNRNIYNSDNYRYLVFLLVPWSVGFGLALRGWGGAGGPGPSRRRASPSPWRR
jgi:hypothetical protein